MEDLAPKKTSPTQWEAVGFVWEVFVSIAAPTVLCALAGRWLDKRYASTPWFMVIFLVLAVAISGLLVYRKAKQFSVKMKG